MVLPVMDMDWLSPLNGTASMRRAGLSALAFTGGSQAAKLVLNVVATLVLVRLLPPEDFGLFAMAALVVNFILVFKDFGLTTATVQQTTLTQRQVSTIFWLGQGAGVAFALLTLAVAPLLAWFFGRPELTPAVMLLGVGFLMGSLASQHDALLRRNLRFATVGVIEVSAMLCGFAVAIAMAATGWGWWSLIWHRLVQLGVILLGTWLACSWRPSRSFSFTEAKEQAIFGLHLSSANFSSYLMRNADSLLIGWYWGATPLGFYTKAYDLLIGPIAQISGPLGQALQPILGRLRHHPERYRVVVLQAFSASLLILMPLGTLMFWQPVLTTTVLLGENWLPAAPIIHWLGLALSFQLCGSIFMWVLVTRQQGARLNTNAMINLLILLAGFVCALPYGPAAVAATYALITLFIRMPHNMYHCIKSGAFSLHDMLTTLRLPLAVFCCLSVAYAVLPAVFPAHTPPWLVLISQCFLGYALMLGLVLPTEFGKFCIQMLKSFFTKPAK